MYIVKVKSDRHNRRWKVREAKSLKHAYNEIMNAMVSGSIGSSTEVNGVVVADVIRINSDNTEARPYEKAY